MRKKKFNRKEFLRDKIIINYGKYNKLSNTSFWIVRFTLIYLCILLPLEILRLNREVISIAFGVGIVLSIISLIFKIIELIILSGLKRYMSGYFIYLLNSKAEPDDTILKIFKNINGFDTYHKL